MVADALSRKVCTAASMMVEEECLIEWISNLDANIRELENGVFWAMTQVEPRVISMIR